MTDIQARTVKEFCRAYGIGVTMTYALIKRGALVTVKVGSRTLIVEASARAWFEGLSAPNPSPPPSPPAGTKLLRIGAKGSERENGTSP